ncbi:hypothetical protein [Clostridium botulinum]|uniref:hypothetical protein n=1 Tax=Clostridium botulinum TaxID=1491 RepID=UPI0005857DC5|nr:hypothetical protein [Clostridium botulinum]AJE09877.1 hypothetical protein T259_2092 [Clostridium botulinum CDC_1436]AJE11124.1 hypothetical protein T259_1817 [Clostridium botulinum CDC_1436]
MLYKEDFESLKLLAENIQTYAELNKKDIVKELIKEMKEQLNIIEKLKYWRYKDDLLGLWKRN